MDAVEGERSETGAAEASKEAVEEARPIIKFINCQQCQQSSNLSGLIDECLISLIINLSLSSFLTSPDQTSPWPC